MVKKVPPYLRSTKSPYIIHPYSPVLAARADMVPWYKAPEIKRYEPIIPLPDNVETEAPDGAMGEDEFRRHVAEQARVEALRAAQAGDGQLAADKVGKMQTVNYDMTEEVVIDSAPDDALTEADFDLIKEPEKPEGPTPAAEHEMPSIDAPVEGTPEGNAAKRHGKSTRKESGIDRFSGVTPKAAPLPPSIPKAKSPSPFARG